MIQEAGTSGIVFPPGPDGTPSSRLAGTRIMAAALGALDARHAQEALLEPRWRHAYPLHFRRLVEGAMASPEAALACARAGLDAAWENLVFARAGGPPATLREASADSEAIEFRGEFLHAFRQSERVLSHLPVLVRRGATEVRAEGFVYDHAARTLEFKGRMRAVFTPPRGSNG